MKNKNKRLALLQWKIILERVVLDDLNGEYRPAATSACEAKRSFNADLPIVSCIGLLLIILNPPMLSSVGGRARMGILGSIPSSGSAPSVGGPKRRLWVQWCGWSVMYVQDLQSRISIRFSSNFEISNFLGQAETVRINQNLSRLQIVNRTPVKNDDCALKTSDADPGPGAATFFTNHREISVRTRLLPPVSPLEQYQDTETGHRGNQRNYNWNSKTTAFLFRDLVYIYKALIAKGNMTDTKMAIQQHILMCS
ncbi:hypothetical protein IEQ34_012214 [Dendrobium chrysotoxum]|uniref:Uncharacterized protein n=1 Tax=Dendrobium chrysotoxum TaxID=161865 RepID=A0AAV7GTJ4_DENCH|nr:hypothetical protein IEQ34_012214 [Dendrobium chrysotoxum]